MCIAKVAAFLNRRQNGKIVNSKKKIICKLNFHKQFKKFFLKAVLTAVFKGCIKGCLKKAVLKVVLKAVLNGFTLKMPT